MHNATLSIADGSLRDHCVGRAVGKLNTALTNYGNSTTSVTGQVLARYVRIRQ